MARHLEREFDESVLMNDDGSYKVQETEGVGNIRKHRHDDENRAPTLRPSLSFPPPHHTSKQGSHRNHGFHTTSKTSVLRCLLRCSYDFNRYDEADSLVQKAVNHFKRALEIDPCNKGLIYDVGRLYQGMNKPEKAVTFFERIANGDLGSFPLELVNAYEQAGLCWLKLSEQPEISDEDQKRGVSRAEDMFMNSLRECRRAVAHMPRISSNRGHLWSSYSEMLGILQKSSGGMGALKKAATVHELVGKYIEAVKVYQDVLQLAHTTDDRKNAILGMVRNYFSMESVKDARFILDLLLTSDQRDIILQDTDTATRDLRQLAVDVYKRAATAALQLGSVRDARLCFQSVLLLRGVVKEIAAGDDDVVYCSGHGDGMFDACIFDDEVSCAQSSTEVADKLAQVSSSLVKIMEMVFGMR
nr:hypothetical protein BaRGS_014018 [Batillaria attramentaria]